jgi:hypothetical protein
MEWLEKMSPVRSAKYSEAVAHLPDDCRVIDLVRIFPQRSGEPH